MTTLDPGTYSSADEYIDNVLPIIDTFTLEEQVTELKKVIYNINNNRNALQKQFYEPIRDKIMLYKTLTGKIPSFFEDLDTLIISKADYNKQEE